MILQRHRAAIPHNIANVRFKITGLMPRTLDLVADWHAPIGKAVLENWGFAEEMCNAVGEQDDHERRWIHDGELSDILIASVALAGALKNPAPLATNGISAFQHIGLTEHDCTAILTQAKHHLGSLHDALGD